MFAKSPSGPYDSCAVFEVFFVCVNILPSHPPEQLSHLIHITVSLTPNYYC